MSNAVKFTAVGEVVIAVTADDAVSDGAVRLRVAVRDTGIGIAADRMGRLFESFSQVDSSTTRIYGGTGLGLAISRRLARAMGGDIVVDSRPGAGSTFTVTVLMQPCPQAGRAAAAVITGRSALIVDDNATNRAMLQGELTGWGIHCVTAASATEALDLIADGARFDIALLDMHMPDTDGAHLAERLNRLPEVADAPRVLLSSVNGRPQDAERDLFAAILSKPVRAGALHNTVAHLLGEGPQIPVEPPTFPEIAASQHQLRVLLAVDNPVNQKVAQLMLTKLGHRVDTVANGAEAVDAVHRAHYDVVLMDMQMPVLDGLDATRRIRKELPTGRQPHIVAMTANALPEDRLACRTAGMDDYLAKPVRPADLAAVLRNLATGQSTGTTFSAGHSLTAGTAAAALCCSVMPRWDVSQVRVGELAALSPGSTAAPTTNR
ncbi:response regulator [Paractinoplanes toevensis]|uniref:histidine kinase n=1 Tax=Paractinoplanes toevensis TaxID=571911 RepID=A0A919W2U8_9ACTN|nr:response regulator [Actinoplanes toevensis]GIM94022.1 hypothetical protein Ato02nite_058150 [Actinoplanes toevensis]